MSKNSEYGINTVDGWTKVFDKRFELINQLLLVDYGLMCHLGAKRIMYVTYRLLM